MRKPAGLLLLAFLVSAASAQEIKFFGGASWARFRETPFVFPDLISYAMPYVADNRATIFGAGLEIPLFRLVSLDICQQYLQKGTVNFDTQDGEITNFHNFKLNILSLPVCLKFKFFPGPSPYILAGGELSYVLRHNAYYWGQDWNLTGSTHRFDIAATAGGGFELVRGKWKPFVEARYYWGLTNINRNIFYYFSDGIHTRTLSVVGGVKLGLGK